MIYLREVREGQAKSRGIPYEKKKQKCPTAIMATTIVVTTIVLTQGGDAGRLRWLCDTVALFLPCLSLSSFQARSSFLFLLIGIEFFLKKSHVRQM